MGADKFVSSGGVLKLSTVNRDISSEAAIWFLDTKQNESRGLLRERSALYAQRSEQLGSLW
jgi:hypothetical protein